MERVGVPSRTGAPGQADPGRGTPAIRSDQQPRHEQAQRPSHPDIRSPTSRDAHNRKPADRAWTTGATGPKAKAGREAKRGRARTRGTRDARQSTAKA
ncbi:hypothetical protein SRO_6052 [Streptomyces rochei]|nr:hypothetical protein SRO_6052 [Streptomyces rochei]